VCDTCRVEFDDNVMANCHGHFGTPGVVTASGPMFSRHNRFTEISPTAAVNWGGAAWNLRDNLFYGNQVALRGPVGLTDALWNWWGDSTGPTHPANPGGIGDSVIGNVLFDPWYTDTTFFPTSVTEEGRTAVRQYELYPAYPNPFNPVATIMFDLNRPGIVTLDVYNISGQKVRELVNRRYEAGQHAIRFDAHELPSGIYFAQMRVGDFLKTEKMVLLR